MEERKTKELTTELQSQYQIHVSHGSPDSIMGIEQCVLLVHSISGVYGLNFVQNYPEKVKGFIAVDNTVYAFLIRLRIPDY